MAKKINVKKEIHKNIIKMIKRNETVLEKQTAAQKII